MWREEKSEWTDFITDFLLIRAQQLPYLWCRNNRQSRPCRYLKHNDVHTLFSVLPLLISIAFRYKDWDPYYQALVIQK